MRFLLPACLAIATVLFAGTPVYAQKKLKVDISADGDTSWSTSETKIYNSPGGSGLGGVRAAGDYLKTSILKNRNGMILLISIQTGRTNMFNIERGAIMEITLADNTTLDLESLRDQAARKLASYYGCFIYASYRLDAASLKALHNQDINNVSVSTSNGKMIFPVKSKDGDSIRNQLGKFD